jgi:hypothetical protein
VVDDANKTTPADVASWMANELERAGYLDQYEAASGINARLETNSSTRMRTETRQFPRRFSKRSVQ